MIDRALKHMRIFHTISQTDLADKLEISRSYLSEIEAGKKSPSLELLEKYANIFSIPVSSILLFSEQLKDDTFPERTRVYAVKKILKIMEWLVEKEKYANGGE